MYFIRCLVCRKLFRIITASHLKKHKISVQSYLEKFPRASLMANDFKENKAMQIGSQGKQNWNNLEYREKRSKEIGERNRNNWKDPEYRNKVKLKISIGNKKAWNGDRERLLKAVLKGRITLWNNEEFRRRHSIKQKEVTKRLWKNRSYRNKVLEAVKKGCIESWKEGGSLYEIHKGLNNIWKNSEYKNNHSRKIARAQHLRPNRLESKFLGLINKHQLPYKYTGNGDLIIDGKVPDFSHVKFPILIELFGEYWHKLEDVRERINFFKERKYICIIFWENQINNNIKSILNILLTLEKRLSQ